MTFSNERREFWEQGVAKDANPSFFGGASEPAPFGDFLQPFEGKQVLEIGPGTGRQFDLIRPRATNYAVADLSTQILDQEKFKGVDKYLIRSYEEDFKREWDVIHFWYVLHHVKRDELVRFIEFLHRHLKSGGHLFFNTPVLAHYSTPSEEGDGTDTTPFEFQEIRDEFSRYGFVAQPGAPVNCLFMLKTRRMVDLSQYWTQPRSG